MISLGPNCHPAYWIRKLNGNQASYPFDWLLSKPEVGLKYVCWNIENQFTLWLTDIQLNHRAHVVSARFPQVEFFHHRDLMGPETENEIAKLRRRASRFLLSLTEKTDYLYCYTIPVVPAEALLINLTKEVMRFLALAPSAKLHLYFMSEEPGNEQFSALLNATSQLSDRLVLYTYYRNADIHKVWGGQPEFMCST